MRYFSPEEKKEIWERLATGQSVRSIALGLGRQASSVRKLVMSTGGAQLVVVKSRSPHFLSFAERGHAYFFKAHFFVFSPFDQFKGFVNIGFVVFAIMKINGVGGNHRGQSIFCPGEFR